MLFPISRSLRLSSNGLSVSLSVRLLFSSAPVLVLVCRSSPSVCLWHRRFIYYPLVCLPFLLTFAFFPATHSLLRLLLPLLTLLLTHRDTHQTVSPSSATAAAAVIHLRIHVSRLSPNVLSSALDDPLSFLLRTVNITRTLVSLAPSFLSLPLWLPFGRRDSLCSG